MEITVWEGISAFFGRMVESPFSFIVLAQLIHEVIYDKISL